MCKRQNTRVYGGLALISEVFVAMEGVCRSNKFMSIAGHMVKGVSDRYRLFKDKGTICVTCGLQADYFKLERFPNDAGFHLNLYGIDHEGDEVLFTKDHIIPKAKGGPNTQANFQTMCSPCNATKKDTL